MAMYEPVVKTLRQKNNLGPTSTLNSQRDAWPGDPRPRTLSLPLCPPRNLSDDGAGGAFEYLEMHDGS